MQTSDVAIIGGGLSGLTAAVYLAQAGFKVTVLEKSKQWGGRAQTVVKQGAMLNLGGHALYRGGEADTILTELGVELQGGSPLAKGFSMVWKNELFSFSTNPIGLISSKLLSASGKIDFIKLMIKLMKADLNAFATLSLREWAEQEIGDPMVRHIFYAFCRTATFMHDPDRQSAQSAISQLRLGMKKGVLYIDGGWQTIVDQLREKAIHAGATVINNKTVTKVEPRDRIHRLHFADDEYLDCAFAIMATSPTAAYRLLQNAEQTSLHRWQEKAHPVRVACLDLALKRLPHSKRHTALWLDQPLFFTHHSRVSQLSRHGDHVVHLFKYIGPHGSSPEEDERQLEQAVDLLHPGWRREVVVRQYLPNMAVVYDAPTIDKKGINPGPAIPEIAGLYVAGDWAGHGEQLANAAFASAKRAAQAVIGDYKKRREEDEVGNRKLLSVL
ncbi:phytoene desaturase family protein [Desmospora activa]|uniref:Phytoene dehydrogenase-like protein n=1 Tax=Desmospora activa DSM 45169 TaxID=1121389 RepID=A0A2T4ZCQ3_9BACL|nr:FAD-dependent oxidoreductase [Desmospora activa]PTM59660.1 phytoene dehydrogenase-like protein [Desmospora activa DSM 45169]